MIQVSFFFKQQHVNIFLELQENANEDPTFISRTITGDENWTSFPEGTTF
jgi:hypothetical protein